MLTDTEAVILRQVKTVNGRRMLTMFTKKYGKISVGANESSGGKSKTNLATRPFTYGKYELYKNQDSYNLSSGQVLESYYEIGEDFDKFQAASYVLELTDRLLPEDMQQAKLFVQLTDFLSALSKRSKAHRTLILAYIVKALDILGSYPELGADSSIEDGGIRGENYTKSPLIYSGKFDIVEILEFFRKEPFKKFEKLALNPEIERELLAILREYLGYHFDIARLKSEEFETGI